MNFVPPPYADDVDMDTGPYSRDEIVVARASLLHTMQRETSQVWRNIKVKLGILPNGYRVNNFEPQHVWLPPFLPQQWTAPVMLHNPRASVEDDDLHPGNAEEGEKKGGKEECSTSSNPTVKDGADRHLGRADEGGTRGGKEKNCTNSNRHVSGTESQLSNGGRSSSTRPSGKRSRESLWTVSDYIAIDDDDDDEGDPVQQKKNQSGEKRRKVCKPDISETVSSLKANDTGEGSNKDVMIESEGDAMEVIQYTKVFQCDICSFLCEESDQMDSHLSQKSHCSASRYVAESSAGKGLRPVYLSVACNIRKQEHDFKEKVVACPQCHLIFAGLSQCLQHSMQVHKEVQGKYCFRDITKTETIDVNKDKSVCPDCKEEIQDKDLMRHITKTQHMALYMGKKGTGITMLFLCPFCNVPYTDYWSFKAHVLSIRHTDQWADGHTQTTICCLLGESQPAQTMLPQDPGVLKQSATQRSKKQGKDTHKERLAAFKEKMKRKCK